MRGLLLLLALLSSCMSQAQLLELNSGHVKGQYLLGTYPDDSVIRDLIGTPSQDINAELRLLAGGRKERWSWHSDYQLILRSGDTVGLSRLLSGSFLVPNAVLEDDRRLMDLTSIISDHEDRIMVHRLDRLHLGFTGDKTVVKIGRQAVSWGNGLIYNPVDFFNPFDPAAVDKEFKNGDDMLYGQYLQDNGNDWQYVSVWRRNEHGNTDSAVNTNALKYHAFVGERELDLLWSRHYEDDIAAIGGISNWGGAIVRADMLLTHTDTNTYFSAVANLSYSWQWQGRNVSGVAEYFYNDMGLAEDDYSQIMEHPDLLARLNRGELFTIGRHYLAGGVTIEITPLLNLSSNMFLNVGDNSGMLQMVSQQDLAQNWQLLLAVNLPFGANGTEFGGLDSPVAGKQLSSGAGIFAQLAFYF